MQRRTHSSLSYLPRTFVAQASPMLTSFSRKERCQLSLAMTKVLFGYMNTTPRVSLVDEQRLHSFLTYSQILNPKVVSICCAVLNFTAKARVTLLSSSLVVLKKTMSYHKPSCFAVRSYIFPMSVRNYTHTHLGSTDGSLSSLTPVDESVFKRLQLLQGQLTRNIQHFAGLNPKAFRFVVRDLFVVRLLIVANSIVRNDHVSKPLTKGILDGNLLVAFEGLSITGQDETTRQIGTERTIVLRDWIALNAPW